MEKPSATFFDVKALVAIITLLNQLLLNQATGKPTPVSRLPLLKSESFTEMPDIRPAFNGQFFQQDLRFI